MSFQTTICNNLHTYEFYGPRVPPCPQCGYPQLKTREEYLKAMGVEIIVKDINSIKLIEANIN